MAKPLSRMIAIALVSTMVAAGAGATCLLWASVAPSHSAGCHPVRVPANPQHNDYRCCLSSHATALTSSVFSSHLAFEPVGDDLLDFSATVHEGDTLPARVAASGGPPGTLILRI